MDETENSVNENPIDAVDAPTETPAVDFPLGDPLLVAPTIVEKAFQIEIDCRERVCYALAYNKVPTVRSIGIRNLNGGVTGQISVEVSMKWSASSTFAMAAAAA